MLRFLLLAALLPLASGFAPGAALLSSTRPARPQGLALRHGARTPLGSRNGCKGRVGASPSALGLTAGLDPGTPLPALDALYFGGVAAVAVGGGLLLYQTYGGQVGLGTFLKTGPEKGNWEKVQARAAEEQKAKMNEEQKGSFFANLLPKLDFVEVYGQEKAAPQGLSELERIVAQEGGKEMKKMLADLEVKLNKAIEEEDLQEAANIQAKMKEITG